MKRLRVCDGAIMSHYACTNGICRVFTVSSLQQLKMGALIPAPADGEVQFVIKFLNAQNIAPIEIHHAELVFREFRVQIPVLTKLIGVIFMVSLSHQGKFCVEFTLPRSI